MKNYCIADIHGNYNLWTQIKNYCKSNDKIFILGDVIDRGSEGIKILQEIMNDNRCIMLLGNHEEMLLNYINYGIKNSLLVDAEVIKANGSLQTLKDYEELTEIEKNKLTNFLKKCNKYNIYINKDKKNILLSHAGLSFNNINNLENENLLWNRDHIKQDIIWNNKYKYWYIVHGHTPIQLINPNKVLPEINRYYNNHKINLDIGTIVSKKLALLDLDTLQVKYFQEEVQDESRDNE